MHPWCTRGRLVSAPARVRLPLPRHGRRFSRTNQELPSSILPDHILLRGRSPPSPGRLGLDSAMATISTAPGNPTNPIDNRDVPWCLDPTPLSSERTLTNMPMSTTCANPTSDAALQTCQPPDCWLQRFAAARTSATVTPRARACSAGASCLPPMRQEEGSDKVVHVARIKIDTRCSSAAPMNTVLPQVDKQPTARPAMTRTYAQTGTPRCATSEDRLRRRRAAPTASPGHTQESYSCLPTRTSPSWTTLAINVPSRE